MHKLNVFWVSALQGQIFLLKMHITKLPAGGNSLLHVVSNSAHLSLNLLTDFRMVSCWWVSYGFAMMWSLTSKEDVKDLISLHPRVMTASDCELLSCLVTRPDPFSSETRSYLINQPAAGTKQDSRLPLVLYHHFSEVKTSFSCLPQCFYQRKWSSHTWGVVIITAPSMCAALRYCTMDKCSSDVPGGVSTIR